MRGGRQVNPLLMMLAFVLLTWSFIRCDTIIDSSSFTGDFNFTADSSPYVITVSHSISGLLTIEPNVQVKMYQGVGLTVGSMLADGTEAPIEFIPFDLGGTWGGLTVNTATIMGVTITGVEGSCAVTFDMGITIQNSTIAESVGSGICGPAYGDNIIVNNQINTSSWAIYVEYGPGGTVQIIGNTINARSGIYIEAVGQSYSGVFNIKNNVVTAEYFALNFHFAGYLNLWDNELIAQVGIYHSHDCNSIDGSSSILRNNMTGRLAYLKSGTCPSNEIKDNVIHDASSAVSVFNFQSDMGPNIEISGNTISNCTVTDSTQPLVNIVSNVDNIGPAIFSNTIEDCTATVAVWLKGHSTTDSDQLKHFQSNTIQRFTGSTLLKISASGWSATHNQFSENIVDTLVELVDTRAPAIDISNNDWGIQDGEHIQSKIIDVFKNPTESLATFTPFYFEGNLNNYSNPNLILSEVTWLEPTEMLGSVYITETGRLNIRRDVQISSSSHLICSGILDIQGSSESDRISLFPSDLSAGWGSIRFTERAVTSSINSHDTFVSGSIIKNAIISGAGNSTLTSAIHIVKGSIYLENVDVTSQTTCVEISTPDDAKMVAKASSFHSGNEFDCIKTYGYGVFNGNHYSGGYGMTIYEGSRTIVTNNTFEVNYTGILLNGLSQTECQVLWNKFSGENGIILSNYRPNSINFTIAHNTIQNSSLPIRIETDVNICSTNSFTIQIYDNDISNNNYNSYAIDITGSSSQFADVDCRIEFRNNDLRGSSGSDTLIRVQSLGVSFNDNKFDTVPLLRYEGNSQGPDMDFRFNSFGTIDGQVISSLIFDGNDSPQFGRVEYNPIFDLVKHYYFDIGLDCHIQDGVCIQYNCSAISQYGPICAGHGYCYRDSNCLCDQGYAGSFCSEAVCGFYASSQAEACSGHGDCVHPNNCTCDEGYEGAFCSNYSCFGIPFDSYSACSANGTCTAYNNCECDQGLGGLECSEYTCNGIAASDESVCDGHGLCVFSENCTCFKDFTGEYCDEYICFGTHQDNSSVCSGHGVCIMNNTCSCHFGYSGDNCSSSDPQYIEVTYSDTLSTCEDLVVEAIILESPNVIASGFIWWINMSTAVDATDLSNYMANQDSNQLVLSSDLLDFGATYTLTVMNYQIPSVERQFTFTVERLNSTLIIPATVYRNSEIQLAAQIEKPVCTQEIDELSYSWTLLFAGSEIEYSSNNSFLIDTSSKSYGHYQVVLTSKLGGQRSQVDYGEFQIQMRDPSVSITGGANSIRLGMNLTLVAVGIDPDSSVPIMYNWTCVLGACANGTITSDIYFFKPAITGVYELSVTATAYDARVATTSITITVMDPIGKVPTVAFITTVPQYVSKQQKLVAEVRVEPAIDRPLMNLKWTLTPLLGGPDLLSKNTLLTTPRSRSLVFIPSAMVQGTAYTLRFTASYIGYPDTASVEAIISLAPAITLGTFMIQPPSGIQFETPFSLSAVGWTTDISALPLKYTFEFLTANGVYVPLRPAAESPTFSARLLANPSNITLIRCKVQNAFGAEAIATNPVTVHPSVSGNPTGLLASFILGATQGNSYQLILAANIAVKQSGSDSIRSVLDVLQKLNDTNSSADLVKQKSQVLSITTSGRSSLDIPTRLQALDLTNSLFSDTASIAIEDDVFQTMGEVIANIALGSDEYNEQLELECSKAIQGLSGSVLGSKISGENSTSISTDAFIMSVVKNYASELEVVYGDDLIGVYMTEIPGFENDTESEVSAEFINFSATTGVLWSGRNMNISSEIVSFKLLDSNGDKINLKFQEDNPLVIILRRSQFDQNGTIVCKYIDDYTSTGIKWSTDGCSLASASETQLICHCNHTTSFAAFVQYTESDGSVAPSETQNAIYYVSVCFYSIFFITSLVVLVVVIVNRNVQPLKSRSFGPCICMIAIMVECLLLVIRNGLWLAKDPNIPAISAVGYIILFISNPLSIVSLFIFLWQIIRFVLLQHAYRIMSMLCNSGPNNRLKVLRVFTSNKVFLGLSLMVYGITFVYFLTYTVAEWSLHKNLSEKVLNANTIALAVSFSGIVVIIGICILLGFLYDSIFVPIQQRKYNLAVASAHENAANEEQNRTEQHKTKDTKFVMLANLLTRHFLRDDPFYFRINMLIMVASILVMFVSYGIGIGNQYLERSDNSPLMIVSLVFDLLYTAIRVIAYAAFVAVVSIHSRFKDRNRFAEFVHTERDRIESPDSNMMNLIEAVMNSRVGFELLKDYSTKEFSVENLLLWRVLQAMNSEWSVTSNAGRQNMMDAMVKRFIKSGSECEVNIPNATRRAVLTMHQNLEQTPVSDQLLALHKLTTSILTNLSDTYSRFSETHEYKQFVQYHAMHKVLEDLMNNE